MVYKLNYILNDIEEHVNKKEPFSLVRIGDGDLKLLAELVEGRINERKFNRSGIPRDRGDWILKLYRDGCNNANYTTSFEMYYTDQFWNRSFSSGTKKKVKAWKKIYNQAGIINTNFCNPEIGHLLFLNQEKNLLKILREKNVCLITSHPRASKRLRNANVNVKVIKIPGINSGHYNKYREIKKSIIKAIPTVDIFLLSAGSIGKGYSNAIKNNGGISIDIGQVINMWAGRGVAKRFRGILKADGLTFNLTKKAKIYRKYL